MLVTMLASDLPSHQVQALRLASDKDKRSIITWMDRVEAEKVVMKAHREGARLIIVGRHPAKAFEFRNPGTIERNTSPKAREWYEVPTSGSLPPLSIAWVDPKELEEFLR